MGSTSMQVINSQIVSGKKVLLRLDLDIPVKDGKVVEDFRLKAGFPTLKLCIEMAAKVIILGHLGRPFENAQDEKKGIPKDLSLKPVYEWLKAKIGEIEFAVDLDQAQKSNSKTILLENLRFFHGEVPGAEYHATCSSKTCDVDFASQLAKLGSFYVNEAFAAHNPAASTTILPTLLPHAAGLRFAEEVRILTGVMENPKKPFMAIMGGAKVEDKLPVIKVLAQIADAVLVGGKIASEITKTSTIVEYNVMVGKLNDEGTDIAEETTQSWRSLIMRSKMIVWNGPLGIFEDPKNDQTKKVAQIVVDSKSESIVGGGDTIAALNEVGLLDKFSFVSTGGGAMLKFLTEGTLPTIEVLS